MYPHRVGEFVTLPIQVTQVLRILHFELSMLQGTRFKLLKYVQVFPVFILIVVIIIMTTRYAFASLHGHNSILQLTPTEHVPATENYARSQKHDITSIYESTKKSNGPPQTPHHALPSIRNRTSLGDFKLLSRHLHAQRIQD